MAPLLFNSCNVLCAHRIKSHSKKDGWARNFKISFREGIRQAPQRHCVGRDAPQLESVGARDLTGHHQTYGKLRAPTRRASALKRSRSNEATLFARRPD